MSVELRVLGQVEVRVNGRVVPVGHARQRCVLVALVVEANRVVPVERLLERVWADRAPHRARQVVGNYVSRLRRALAGEVVIASRGGGYALEVDPDLVDLHRFRRLVARARGGEVDGLALLEEAVGLWRGEAFGGVDTPWIAAAREGLERERLAAELDRVDLALAHGGRGVSCAELAERADAHPLDERVAGQLMLALYRDGRQAEALRRFDGIRARLADEVGVDPGRRLRELHLRMLATDRALDAPAAPDVPRQLPASPVLAGRVAELALLDRALAGASGTLLVSAIGGAGGIGKTWLALAWAHRHLDEFPDGQLFVDLRGFSPSAEPVAPDVVVRGFLDALGVAPGRAPADPDARAALYRSLVAGRRVLVVLDNAATAEQVVPLLPGSPSCAVLVTCRPALASLIDRHGARHLALGVLGRADARALLAARVGAERAAAEAEAVDGLVELCGGHPLALSITARNAATRPLAEVEAELRELGLGALAHGTDPAASLPSVLSWSLRGLTDHQRTAFALLGAAPGPDTATPAAAALLDLPPVHAREVLTALVEASLLDRRPGGRYAMHDLVRGYAHVLARDLPEDVRGPALARVLDFHVHTAFAADRLLDPHRPLVRPDPPAPGADPLPLPDAETATAWLRAEHPTLLAAQRAAADLGHHHAVWHLARALDTFHRRQGRRDDALAAWRAALTAAGRLPDPSARSRAHRNLGRACARVGLHGQAAWHLERALALAVRHHDLAEQAHTHQQLAIAGGQRGEERWAVAQAERAADLYRALGQPVWEGDALNVAGWFAALLGELDVARGHCAAALALFRRHHHPDGEAAALDSLALVTHRAGDHRAAVEHYRRALALFRERGDTYEVANTLDRAGHPHVALGRCDRAREVWREAERLYREQGRAEDVERVVRQLDALGGC
ncbi:AfsR/SARP family transcriptional regulator [Actinosynnema pretiosum]|uniref:AfsR/SARP family transcriptional regulator n=1 Tax=Actinosynnema pretiosum TaxID=42197 RepID=UPI001E3EE919|nr:BTAD domain-containing putative transcriptional regulator [Actinosynnema pretiosum]